jgi:hypothetical protein
MAAATSQTLIHLAETQQVLVTQFLASLAPNTTTTTTTTDASSSSSSSSNLPPNPLHVLRDSATLLKAHTTKLALLLINKPFTPSAVSHVLGNATQSCLAAMMSAVELCRADLWGVFLHHHVVAKVRTVMREMGCFLDQVVDAAREHAGAGAGAGAVTTKSKKDTLASTGVLWDACDDLVRLDELGIAGLAVVKAQELRDSINDAIQELQEWQEGDGNDDDDDDDDEDDDDDDEEDAHSTSDNVHQDKRYHQDEFDDMFSAANKLPKDRPDLKQRLASAVDKLKKIQFLYAAITKRRLQTFSQQVAAKKVNLVALDKVMLLLKELPESVDELANAFYEIDAEQIDIILAQCIDNACSAANLLKTDWNDKEDEFTAWATKWIALVKQVKA